MNSKYLNTLLLVLRISVAIAFVYSGGQKLFGFWGTGGPDETIHQFYSKLGLPAAVAWLVMIVEFFGGLAILLGLFTRIASIALIINTIGIEYFQIVIFDAFSKKTFMHDVGYPGLIGLLCIQFLLLGPGKYSLDSLFKIDRSKPVF